MEPAQPDSTQEPVEDLAEDAVACPFVLGPLADELAADRAVLAELIALGEHRHPQIADTRQNPRVWALDTRDQPQQGRLALAVTPDHADPIAGRDPERDLVQHRSGGVALVDAAQVDEVADRAHRLGILTRSGSRRTTRATVLRPPDLEGRAAK